MVLRRGRQWGSLAVAATAIAVAIATLPASRGNTAPEQPRVMPVPISRIMPLGDSITDGSAVPGGYRVGLAQLLHASGQQFDFVGSMENGPPALADRQHEGHSGWRIDELHARAHEWVSTAQPDAVLLLAGTNDIWQRYDVDRAPARLLDLLVTIDRAAPGALIVVSTLPPFPERAVEREAFNASLMTVISAARARGIRAVVTTAGSTLSDVDLYDGVHPNETGHTKLAAGFYATLRPLAANNA